ncbi:MAG: YqhA family protein, partial [Saprospiraceae bacterium]|nr:YqhA family protein [Saprospiraceae bacterium]
NLPEWFRMKDIDQLKSMLIKVTIVVMGVSFTGRIVTWDGSTDLLGYGIGLGVVILALSYFLNVKIKEKKSDVE